MKRHDQNHHLRRFSLRRASVCLAICLILTSLLTGLLTALVEPAEVHALGSASFSISGQSTLEQGQTATYTVKVTVNDAAAAQAKLVYDSSFFEWVSGNVNGIWDAADNTSTTATLTTVTLRCIAATGTSGVLSLTGVKASRLTGRLDSPTESVIYNTSTKTVSNPAPTTTQATTTQATTTKATTTQATTTKATTTRVTTTASGTAATTEQPKPSPLPTATTAVTGTATTTTTATTPSTATGATSGTAPLGTTQPSGSTLPSGPAPITWDGVRNQITGLSSGGTITISQLPDSRAPISVLKSLQDRKAKITLDFGRYSWLIDGSLLNRIPEGLADIDLSMSMDENLDITRAAGGEALYQLHFNHEGELPGRMMIGFVASKNKPGDRLYLYTYYGLAGVMQGIQTAVVNPDGTVRFELFHCSSYFVTSRMLPNAVNSFPAEGLTGLTNSGGAGPGGTNNGGTGSAGRNVPLSVLIACMLVAALLSAVATMGAFKVGVFRAVRVVEAVRDVEAVRAVEKDELLL